MKNILSLSIVLFFLLSDAQAQFIKSISKFSTIYVSGNIGQPLQESTKEWFVTQSGQIQDVTEIYPFDYTISFGIRKMARFDYENKPNVFYDGSEDNISYKANVGAVDGFEYVFAYDLIRQRGDQYRNQNYFIRYLGKHWSAHIKLLEEGIVDLKYAQADLRAKQSFGRYFNITAGAVVRTHGPYGYNPIAIYLNNNQWWDLAYEYEYTDESYIIIDYTTPSGTPDTSMDWSWKNKEGEKIASTDGEFRRYYFGDIVNEFNAEKMAEVGSMVTLSAAIGLDFYKYNKKFWCHAWVNVLPYHKHIYGDTNFSYGLFISSDPEGNGSEQWIDYNCGLIIGTKVGKHFGLFLEGDYLQYWDKTVYSAKAGVNYLIF